MGEGQGGRKRGKHECAGRGFEKIPCSAGEGMGVFTRNIEKWRVQGSVAGSAERIGYATADGSCRPGACEPAERRERTEVIHARGLGVNSEPFGSFIPKRGPCHP
eukprot:2819392-Pleurochrysis_carterae.AAC.2